MARNLPPMLSVRAFEAAARHGGFARAGEELCVSAGAVGHQVKLLEEWLGVDLFVRRPRSVELTESGRHYFSQVKGILEDLERASLDVRRWRDDGEVTVTAMPSFVTRWLMPRLGRFRAAHPDIEVRLLASVPPVDFTRDQVDLAVRLGTGPYPGMAAEHLLDEHFFALASPAFMAQVAQRGALSVQQLLGLTLLHDEHEPRIPEQMDWPRWFGTHGIAKASPRMGQGLRFSHTYLTLDAATAGQGVALASDVLAGDGMRAGALVVAAGNALKGPYAYHLLRNSATASRSQVARFAQWLVDEAQAFGQSP
ncbi:MAG TPA: transcriptional regulator GcvA [Burkholderiaceae bacterium]|nr:transcriptional regulator GcvA [Burkholderiaceae bacterium]